MAETTAVNSSWRIGVRDNTRNVIKTEGDSELSPTTKSYSKWTKLSELGNFLTKVDLSDTGAGIPAAGIPIWSDGNTVYFDSSEAHTLILAMTGSGKTRAQIMPMVDLCIEAKESMAINDPKGEITAMFYNKMLAAGYDIRILNIREPDNGDCWNPFSLPYELWMSGDEDGARELLSDIAHSLSAGKISDDHFWDEACEKLIYGCSCVMVKRAQNADEVNPTSLADMIMRVGSGDYSAERFLDSLDIEEDRIELYNISVGLRNAENTRRCIVGMVYNALGLLISRGDLSRMMSRNDFDMSSIGVRPTAFIIITPDETSTYNTIVGRFVTQLNSQLIRKAQEFPDKRLPVRVNMILDEFASLTEIRNMPDMLAASRGRNVRYTMVIQSMSQLKIYKDAAETIFNNCSNIIFLSGRDMDFMQRLCQFAGNDINGRPLVTPSQLIRLKKCEESFVLCGREYPMISRITDISRYNIPAIELYYPPPQEHPTPEVIGDGIFRRKDERSPKRKKITQLDIDDLMDSLHGSSPDTEDEITTVGPLTSFLDVNDILISYKMWAMVRPVKDEISSHEALAVIDFAECLGEAIDIEDLFDDIWEYCVKKDKKGFVSKYDERFSRKYPRNTIVQRSGKLLKAFGRSAFYGT